MSNKSSEEVTKEPDKSEDLRKLQPKVSEETLSSFYHKGGHGDVYSGNTKSSVVRDGNLPINQNQEHHLSTNFPSIPEPLAPGTVAQEIGQGSDTGDVLTSLKDELVASGSWNQCHGYQGKIRQLEEQLKQIEAEKRQCELENWSLQAELGRYQFREDKQRRSESILLSSTMACGSDQNRLLAATASPALASVGGRLYDGAALLQEPGCPSIQSMLDAVQLLQGNAAKSPVSESTPLEDNSLDLLLERRDRERQMCGVGSLTSGRAHFQGGEGNDQVRRTEESDYDSSLHASISSSGSSAEIASDMSVLSLNVGIGGSSSQSALNTEECTQFHSSSEDGFLSNANYSTAVSSSDPSVSSPQNTQVVYSNGTSQDSHDSSPRLMPVNPHSATATREISSDGVLNPTSSEEESLRRPQLSSNAGDQPENGVAEDCAGRSEEREERPVDLYDGAVRPMQSETNTLTVYAETNSTDSGDWSQQGAFPDDNLPMRMRAAGASSGSPTDWERLGERPKQVQGHLSLVEQMPQVTIRPVADGLHVAKDFLARHSEDRALHESYQDCLDVPLFTDTPTDWEPLGTRPDQIQVQHSLAKQVPREVKSPVTDGLTRDFLARHSQDKALCESLYWDSAVDVPLFSETPLQNASSVNEPDKAKLFLGNCQAASRIDPYDRLGRPLLDVSSRGMERSGSMGGFSYSDYLNGNSALMGGPRPSHLGGGNVSIHGNYSPWNASNATSSYSLQNGFVHTAGRSAGVEHFGREPCVPSDRHSELQQGVFLPVSRNDLIYSGMTGSSFVDGLWMGAVGIQPGYPVYGAQRYTAFNDNTTSTITPEQRHTPQSVNVVQLNQSQSTSYDDCMPHSFAADNKIVTQGTADGNTEGGDEPCSGAVNNSSSSSVLNRDFGTDSVEPTDNSLLALEPHVAEACALVERVLREREEREEFGREIERKEQQIREQRARERREREAREVMEANRWPQQQEAITACPQWLCEHYQRQCRVQFPCCTQFYPCHHCHNNSTACDNDKARACHATHLKCCHCKHEQEIGEDSRKCRKCGGKMSAYFCFTCKHFTSVDKSLFHCEMCNVCLDRQLEGNHRCRPDSGHDQCCLCLEDAFSGFQILPCSHKVHRECVIAMIQNGIRTCPMCQYPLYRPVED